jgi:hypothetical protein
MPVYRVFLDGADTGEYVTASSWQDAYFDVSAALPLTYNSVVRLEEVDSPAARPGFPVGRRTIRGSGLRADEQELHLPQRAGPDVAD